MFKASTMVWQLIEWCRCQMTVSLWTYLPDLSWWWSLRHCVLVDNGIAAQMNGANTNSSIQVSGLGVGMVLSLCLLMWHREMSVASLVFLHVPVLHSVAYYSSALAASSSTLALVMAHVQNIVQAGGTQEDSAYMTVAAVIWIWNVSQKAHGLRHGL
jgi:hypothetical protein